MDFALNNLEFILSGIALFFSLVSVYRTRRHLFIIFRKRTSEKFHAIANKQDSNPYNFKEGIQFLETHFSTDNFDFFEVSELIISNNSPNPVTVQLNGLISEDKLVNTFHYKLICRNNPYIDIDVNVGAWYPDPRRVDMTDSSILEAPKFTNVTLYTETSYQIDAFSSRSFNYALVSLLDEPIPDNIVIEVHTTIPRFFLIKPLIIINNFIIRKILKGNHQSQLIRIRNIDVKEYRKKLDI